MKQCKEKNKVCKMILSQQGKLHFRVNLTKLSIWFLFLICIIAGDMVVAYNHGVVKATDINKDIVDSEDKQSNQAAKKSKAARANQSAEQIALYNYLSNNENCKKLFNNAVKANNGDVHDTCVLFLSEALRKVNINVPRGVCFTGRYKTNMKNEQSLIKFLLDNGWKIDYNPKHLIPGDICFSIDQPGKGGRYPTHVYTFMGWKKEGSTGTAYVVDNQGYKFGGNSYHERNITEKGPHDPFHFFMYKPIK